MNPELQDKIDKLPNILLTGRMKDLTNHKQGKITFIKPAEKIKNRMHWWVICDCGEIFKVRSDSSIKSCKSCQYKQQSEERKGILKKDLTGQKFGKLKALYPTNKYKNSHILWHCKCDCGKELDVIGASLTSGNTKSCGCIKRQVCNFVQLKNNLIGQKFGYLTVLEETDKREYGKIIWKCQCDCGNIVYLNTSRLTSGNDTSCGCKTRSLGENIIRDLLLNNQINFIQEYSEDSLNRKRFDFAILDVNQQISRLIEYDGEQHYFTTGGWNNQDQLQKCIKSDSFKNEWVAAHNIPLVRIPYWERDNITLDMLLGDQYLVKGDT